MQVCESAPTTTSPGRTSLSATNLVRNSESHIGDLDARLRGEGPEEGMVVAQLELGAWRGMVEEEDRPLRVGNPVEPHFPDLSHRQGARAILGIDEIDGNDDDLARPDRPARMVAQDLFSQRLSHKTSCRNPEGRMQNAECRKKTT